MKGHILAYLEHHGSVKRKELLSYLHSLGINTSDRLMRKEIEGLIDDGFLISSSEKGYKIIRNEDELQEAVNYLRKKALPLFDRIAHLQKSFQLKNTRQTQLF